MKRPQRQEFDENSVDAPHEQDQPRVWRCAANGCPHVGSIRLPGHAERVCSAHAMAESRHWQRVTAVLVQHRELLAACRVASAQACGMRGVDIENAQALFDTAELMPTGLPEFLPADLRDKAQNAGVRSRVVALAVEKAVIDRALVGAKRKAGQEPQVDEEGEVATAGRVFSSLLAQAVSKVESLREYLGVA